MKKAILSAAVLAGLIFCGSTSVATADDFTLQSNSFEDGATIPNEFVHRNCGGQNRQPHLSWSNAPSGTKSFALVMDDPDAQSVVGYTWVHLNAYNIPLDVSEVLEGDKIQGAKYGQNHGKVKRYSGPCAPKGSHTYIFAIYAMSDKITLKKAHNRSKFEKVFSDIIVGKAEYTGTWR
jgi:Raf kinase inhibitor-like YbhB/YbcL family protein